MQGSIGPLIVGASYLRSLPSDRRSFVRGFTEFSGFDLRWMYAGVQLRGEWIDGQPFAGRSTRGGYLDAIVHRPMMGPVTAVVRAERLTQGAGARDASMADALAQVSRAVTDTLATPLITPISA